MKVEISCPHCGTSYRISRSRPGSDVLCRNCGRTFSVASRQSSTSGPPPPPLPSAPPPRDELPEASGESLPERIGRFRIQRLLGSGAFGTVYLADDPVLDRQVALKVLQRHAAGGSKALTRFVRESKIAAQLRHPQIVPVFDAGTDGQRHFIASAYVEGETLEEEIERDRPDPRRAAWVCQRLADALNYAHKLSVMHRDVKSSNVMVDPAGDVHLMDFGLARLGGSDERLTRDGAVLGTPAYMAPEQASTEFGVVGPQSDQYSLGVVLYELLCGQVPFSGPPTAVLFNVTSTEPATPRSIAREVPRDLETICLKAMAKRPEQRYEDCGELAEDLRRWLADEAITARRVSSLERLTRWSKRNPIAALLIGAVAMLVLLTAIVPSVRYYVVAGQVARREIEEGRKEDLEKRNAEARGLLAGREAKLEELQAKAEKLASKNEEFTTQSHKLQRELDKIRGADALKVLEEEVRKIVQSDQLTPELELPPRKIPPGRSSPRQIPEDRPPITPLMPQQGKPKPLMIGQADELAAHVPENCLYARFGSLQSLQWLLQSARELYGPSGSDKLADELADLQTQLCLPRVAGESAGEFALADTLVAGLAIVGTDGFPSDGIGIVVQTSDDESSILLGGLIRWHRNWTVKQQADTTTERPVVIDTHAVSLIESNDGSGRVRSFYAVKGNLHLITNSKQIVEGLLRAGQGVRAVAFAEDFEIVERRMHQEPKPYAMFFIPKAFWSEPELAKLKPLTGFISEMDRAPDGHRSLSAEVVVPSCWIELLDAYQRHARWIEGPVVMPVYRLLAQHAPSTRLPSVPGDRGFLEIALTDTCRLFGGLHGSEWGAERNEFYHGIAGGAQLDAVLPLWQNANGFGARMLCSILSDVNEDLRKEGLDDEGYGGSDFLKSDSLELSISRRVFNGDWVALSPKKTVLEDVTPEFKKELEPARPATIRFRLNNITGGLLPMLPSEIHIPDCISAFALDIAIYKERLLAYAKITWNAPEGAQPRPGIPPLTPRTEEEISAAVKALRGNIAKTPGNAAPLEQPTGWQRLEVLWQRLEVLEKFRKSAPLRERAEREILATVDTLSQRIVGQASDDASVFKALGMLHDLEQRLPPLQTADPANILRRLRERKEVLLDRLSQSFDKRDLTLAEWWRLVPTTDPMVRKRVREELKQGVDELVASDKNAKELRELWDLLGENDGNVESVRTRIEAKLLRMVGELADDMFKRHHPAKPPMKEVEKLLKPVPNTVQGRKLKDWVNARHFGGKRRFH